MEKQVTFHDLATHLRMLLESESYSQTTVKDMDFILNSFASYMDKNGLVVYSPEIGERLIQYCEVELKVCASRVTRARVIVRKLNRLNQGLDGREALWGDKTSPIVLPADFEKILSAYISYCRKKGNKQTNVSTEIVRRVLGHGTKHAIKHYARIDIKSMQLCPLAVPEPGGLFAEMLLWEDGDDHV